MCVQLHSTTLKQLAIKARAKDGRTTLTHTGGTCITTQLSTSRDACSHLHSMCQQSWVVCSASEAPKSRVIIPQYELSQSCSSTSCLGCTRVEHLLQLCCGMKPRKIFSIQHSFPENLHCRVENLQVHSRSQDSSELLPVDQV